MADKTKNSKLKFTMAMDIDLLKESILQKPFNTEHGNVQQSWVEVTEILNYTTNWKTIRNRYKKITYRFYLLINSARSKNVSSLKSSGTSEQYTERDKLLDDAINLVDDASIKSGTEKDLGKFYRDESMLTPKRQRTAESDIRPKRANNVLDIFKTQDSLDLVKKDLF